MCLSGLWAWSDLSAAEAKDAPTLVPEQSSFLQSKQSIVSGSGYKPSVVANVQMAFLSS